SLSRRRLAAVGAVRWRGAGGRAQRVGARGRSGLRSVVGDRDDRVPRRADVVVQRGGEPPARSAATTADRSAVVAAVVPRRWRLAAARRGRARGGPRRGRRVRHATAPRHRVTVLHPLLAAFAAIALVPIVALARIEEPVGVEAIRATLVVVLPLASAAASAILIATDRALGRRSLRVDAI